MADDNVDPRAAACFPALREAAASQDPNALAIAVTAVLLTIMADRSMEGASDFEDCCAFLSSVFSTRTCQASWSEDTLVMHCVTCGVSYNSCVCFDCYTAGCHEGHRVWAFYAGSGNCDCGDSMIWRPSGFCPCHPGADAHPDRAEMSAPEREAFCAIFTVLLEQLPARARAGPAALTAAGEAIVALAAIGDATRRCCARAFGWIDAVELARACAEVDRLETEILLRILGCLVNDAHFRVVFADRILGGFRAFIESAFRLARAPTTLMGYHDPRLKGMGALIEFVFHESVPRDAVQRGLERAERKSSWSRASHGTFWPTFTNARTAAAPSST